MSEATIVKTFISEHVMTSFEAVAVQPHSSSNFVTGYLHAPAVYPPGCVSDNQRTGVWVGPTTAWRMWKTHHDSSEIQGIA